MTPDQLKKARRKLRLTVRELAHILNTTERTVRKWENTFDERPVNPVAARAVEWMLKGFRPEEWPQDNENRNENQN